MKPHALLVVLFAITTTVAAAQERARGASPPGRLGKSRTMTQLPPVLKTEISFSEPSGNNILDAGETGMLWVNISNSGKGDGKNLLLKITSLLSVTNFRFLEQQTIPLVSAGASVQVTVPLQTDEEAPTAKAKLRVEVLEPTLGADANPAEITFQIHRLEPPDLMVTQTGINDGISGMAQGNNNGKIEKGESIEITAIIQNRGTGIAKEVKVSVREFPTDIYYQSPVQAFSLGDIQPGNWRKITFAVYVNKRFQGAQIPFTLSMQEHRARFSKVDTLSLPVNQVTQRAAQIVVQGREETGKVALHENMPELTVDVDQNIPNLNIKNHDAVAVIIGLSQYANPAIPTVDFAVRDASVMRDYLIKQFGYDPVNIFFLTDAEATKGAFDRVFHPKGQLANYVKPGQSDVFVYYSGHGAPDVESKLAFFVPYDCDPNYAKQSGYPVSGFYNNLSRLGAKSVTVVIDACFSGSTVRGRALIRQVSPIGIKVINPIMTIPNGVVFTAASAEQVACWYSEKKHGLFTYFFLKGLQGEADKNGDHQITTAELREYLTEKVPYFARKLNGQEQMPEILSSQPERVLARW